MSIQLNQAENIILHITSDGRLVPGSGLAEDEVTKRMFALMVAQFEDAWARRERERAWRTKADVLRERKDGWYWVNFADDDGNGNPVILHLGATEDVVDEAQVPWDVVEIGYDPLDQFAGPLSSPDAP